MNKLVVLYDASCGFCVSCRSWLGEQPAFVPLEFTATGSAAAASLFPDVTDSAGELVVVGDDGAVYRGPDAFIMALWALVEYRELSMRLASPLLKPFARAAFRALGRSRRALSWLLRLEPEELADRLSEGRTAPVDAAIPLRRQ